MNAYPIYLDYNATTPCDPRVLETMLPFFSQHFGNAASKSHAHGWFAEEAVDRAREQVASLIGSTTAEIIFTSGATESVNLAIQGYAERNAAKGKHIITIATEHKAVLDTCEYLSSKGYSITIVPVDSFGMIDLSQLEASIQKDTLLIAAMYANNETGVIFPVKEVGRIARDNGVTFFCDATQAVGKVPVDVTQDNIDLMAFSGHKMYGPKGVGTLYVRKKDPMVEIASLFYGGGHERKMRSGTLNVPGIVGLGKAAEICQLSMKEDAIRLYDLREQFWNGIKDIPGVKWNGDKENSLSHVANICFDIPGGDNLIRVLSKYMSVSSGSACSSATVSPSHVLKAMGLSDQQALSSIRFSLGRKSSAAEIKIIVEVLSKALQRMQ